MRMMNCFGDKVSCKSLHCKIVLLDEQQLVHEVHVSFRFIYFCAKCCALRFLLAAGCQSTVSISFFLISRSCFVFVKKVVADFGASVHLILSAN